MQKRLLNMLLLLIENLPVLLTLGFAAYVIALNEVSPLSSSALLRWILVIIGLLATSEVVERFGRLRRIEAAVFNDNYNYPLMTIRNAH